MAALKLARLPDRTPVKIGIVVLPELNDRLSAYAAAYAAAYGLEEPVAALIPAMLGAFLDSDREFAKTEKGPRYGG
ncbi:DUF2274 domain-containing protein [Sphingopyxis sp. MSC1_008]|jgi:hypothetical protein|uniref:DUF2274 domain-containing protein n=1 Tax=Sphingopyxis sp. MSC1_008 TaxID=2909265 RepID=UPI0020BF0057|nr:DUF2274 domain-containing protein [Sphingopyxis sp. MSC1_008]